MQKNTTDSRTSPKATIGKPAHKNDIMVETSARKDHTMETGQLDISRIGKQNDAFRQNLGSCQFDNLTLNGKIVLSQIITALPLGIRCEIVLAVRDYSAFLIEIDPCAEHCFGTINHPTLGKIFWKIEYFTDESCELQSADLEIANGTFRVLTILHSDEW